MKYEFRIFDNQPSFLLTKIICINDVNLTTLCCGNYIHVDTHHFLSRV